MEPITLLTFHEVDPARQVLHRLRGAGIDAEIDDEGNLQKYWFISKPLASKRLRVPKEAFNRANGLLTEWRGQGPALQQAVHCPSCGSSRLEYPQFGRKFILPVVGAFLCAVGLVQRKFYCEDCHYTWPSNPKVDQQPADLLGWPHKKQSGH